MGAPIGPSPNYAAGWTGSPARRRGRPAGIRVDQLVNALAALPSGRKFIDDRKVDRAGAIGLYSGMVSAAFQAFAGMATLTDPDINRQALALTALGRSRELLGQSDALLAGALTAGRFAEGNTPNSYRPSATNGGSPRAPWPTCPRAAGPRTSG